MRKVNADINLAEANVEFTSSQTRNTSEDNARSLAIMLDKHHQEWADLAIKAAKEGIQPPVKPSIEELVQLAKSLMSVANEQQQTPGMAEQQPEGPGQQGLMMQPYQ